jgi:DNA-binding MarR family transcriptional regulator
MWNNASVANERDEASWTFLTNHAHVLLAIAAEPDILLREIAQRVGITERATHRIVAELGDAGYLKVTKVGRRNTYTVVRDRPLRHPAEQHHRIGELLKVLSHRRAP